MLPIWLPLLVVESGVSHAVTATDPSGPAARSRQRVASYGEWVSFPDSVTPLPPRIESMMPLEALPRPPTTVSVPI